MKITEMVAREDFYAINERTLNRYYKSSNDECTLYIYPKLNAIVTRNPGNAVKDYIKTEYTLNSFAKRIAANAYINMCFNSHGRLAERKQIIHYNVCDNTLIYPCNKKIRIFDFDNNIVSVILKDGFDSYDLQHEIEFRKKEDNPIFVPRLLNVFQNGYTEQIIDGKPLVRLSNQSVINQLKQDAYNEFRYFYKNNDREIESEKYINSVVNSIIDDANRKKADIEAIKCVIESLYKIAVDNRMIPVVFSHGDFQMGNIWVENRSNKIFIIDWESWCERSEWYDQDVLFNNLRPGEINTYLSSDLSIKRKSVVLIEDIAFHLHEICSLPYNSCFQGLYSYLNAISNWIKEVK